MKAAPPAAKMLWDGRITVLVPRRKVPEVPRLMIVPEVVKACPPGARVVVPIGKPEASGVNVAPAAV